MIYHNNTNIQKYLPLVFDFSKGPSLQELKRWNDQDGHWLRLKMNKLEKHIHQIELYIAYEVKEIDLVTKKRLRTINSLFGEINKSFIRLEYYDEKSKNLLLCDVEDSLIKLKKLILSLENDISTYN